MPRSKRTPAQTSFLENYGKTAPAVPALRTAVQAWREEDYPGVTATTRRLLNYWFRTDHKLATGQVFRYYDAQREAVETLIYVFEVAKIRSRQVLYEQFIPADYTASLRLPAFDAFARYCTKMATGSGKTKVMALAIAWQYFNAVREVQPDYASTFLIVAPNIIVFERLMLDFRGGRIFRTDPIIPKEFSIDWDMQAYMRGEPERTPALGALYLTNVQQLYPAAPAATDEPAIMTLLLGNRPAPTLEAGPSLTERIAQRPGAVMVLNDEAHHTHDEDSQWNAAIRELHAAHPTGITLQLDVSATPRYDSGGLFAWTISDYTLKQAIIDRIIKRPVKGITTADEVSSDVAPIRYQAFLIAGVERWREYRQQLAPLGKRPLLFIMLNKTQEADEVAAWLREKYPDEFSADRTLVIHTNNSGEISKSDLETVRQAARDVDQETSPVNAIVSVLMLREGWDVQNVTVIVGLRPFTAKANILPEQTIGRGLRLMFRGQQSAYLERVDIIGNKGFINFIEQLEKDEDIQFSSYEVGKDKLEITVIQPQAERAAYDIAIPTLSPILARSQEIAAEIDAIDVMAFKVSPLPLTSDSREAQQFRYEGRDILTLETLIERQYAILQPQTAGEVIAFCAQVIAHELKFPSQFAVLAPKVRDFFRYRAFGQPVDLDQPHIIAAIARGLTQYVTVQEFTKLLRQRIVTAQEPTLLDDPHRLSDLTPFPWSRRTAQCVKTIFNRIPCDNDFEFTFAHALDQWPDVRCFAKLPLNFGFSIPYADSINNLRQYYPDFVAVDAKGVHYLIETKGMEDIEVANKDQAALVWAENATRLTDQHWHYLKVRQAEFQKFQPSVFADCVYMAKQQTPLLPD